MERSGECERAISTRCALGRFAFHTKVNSVGDVCTAEEAVREATQSAGVSPAVQVLGKMVLGSTGCGPASIIEPQVVLRRWQDRRETGARKAPVSCFDRGLYFPALATACSLSFS